MDATASNINPGPFQEHVNKDNIMICAVHNAKGQLGSIDELRLLIKAGKFREAKQLVRDNNWPLTHPIRCHLWTELSQMQVQEKIKTENLYSEIVKQMFGQNCLWLAYKRNHLQSCLKNIAEESESAYQRLPTFVDEHHKLGYNLTRSGTNLVNRILSVVGYSYPAITYSPLIYPITCLLLHYIPENETYNSLCALLSWKQGRFIPQTKMVNEVAWRSAARLAKKYTKAAYGNISRFLKDSETLDHVFEQWNWLIFKHLPFEHLVRVMDCFLFEGGKVLYRVFMAILILFHKHSGRDNIWAREISANGVLATLAKFCQEIPVTSEKLLKVAFGIKNFSQSDVNKTFIRAEMEVNSNKSLSKAPSTGGLVRSRSNEGIPTSQSQVAIQSVSHTLTVHERSRSMDVMLPPNITSNILAQDELLVLWSWLPTRITMYQPDLIYTSEEHGCSLTTFYGRVEHYMPTVIIVKTTTNEIFGAYCSASWSDRLTRDDSGQRHTYFGTGETFIFTIKPAIKKYPWVGIGSHNEDGKMKHNSELFMAGDSNMLTIGGGKGQAIWLDEDLRFGRTEVCDTFNNPPLCCKHDFECKVVEVFGFT